MKLAIVIAIPIIVVIVVILGISTIIDTYAQLNPQPLTSLQLFEIPEDVTKDQVSQIIGNKTEKDHKEKMENASGTCDEKEEEIKELQVCTIEGGNKINSDPLGLFADISNKTQ